MRSRDHSNGAALPVGGWVEHELRGVHPEKLGYVPQAPNHTEQRRAGPQSAGWVHNQLRFDEVDLSSTNLDVALARGEDILHPLDIRAVGQRKDVLAVTGPNIDRRAIHPSRSPAMVGAESVPRHVAVEKSRQRVDDANHC